MKKKNDNYYLSQKDKKIINQIAKDICLEWKKIKKLHAKFRDFVGYGTADLSETEWYIHPAWDKADIVDAFIKDCIQARKSWDKMGDGKFWEELQ
jgi:hypothetical protein